jgi:hypothetical protein
MWISKNGRISNRRSAGYGLAGSVGRASHCSESHGQVLPRLVGSTSRSGPKERLQVTARNPDRFFRPADGHRATHALAPFHPPKWPRFRRYRHGRVQTCTRCPNFDDAAPKGTDSNPRRPLSKVPRMLLKNCRRLAVLSSLLLCAPRSWEQLGKLVVDCQ